MRVSWAAHSRTCDTEPGAEVIGRNTWLDGVDDDDFGLMLFQGRLNRFHADFGKQVYAFGGQFQTLRA